MHFFVNVRSSSIHGIRFGSGNQLLICFHGFGEDAEKFRALHSGLSDRYMLIAIDLPAGAAPPDPTVPEPASLALAGLALAGLGVTRRRKAAQASA